MTVQPDLTLGRRGLIAKGLAGTATLLAPPALAFAQAAGTTNAQSQDIIINRARVDPIPIAIPPFAAGGGEGSALGSQIAGVVSADLARCGLFRVIDAAAAASASAGETPDFSSWKAIGTQALAAGRIDGGGSGTKIQFRLWDVLQGKQIQGTEYSTSSGNWRRIAHIIADVIYERMLGEKGYFDTRIVYIAGTGPRDRHVKRLAIMDQDSANNRFLTDGAYLTLTPRFHPTQDEIAFMSYARNRPRVYLFNLGSGSQRVLGEFDGMTFAPRFSPSGNNVVMSVTRGGGSDIVTVGLGGGGERRLTNSSGAIDTSPCYSADGSQIVFNSDRGGDQQLYIMGADGGGARRISFGSGQYATPVWSPRGDLIAFTRINGGTFSIGVMHPDGAGERILSTSYYADGPTFCPNGRVLMFWRDTPSHSARLVSIGVDGFNERAVQTSTDASDPAWSPLGA